MGRDADRPVAPNDVVAMAQYYDINPVLEPQLLWIVREALQTPLPPTWSEDRGAEGEPIYINEETGEIQQSHPADAYYEQLITAERQRSTTAELAEPAHSQLSHDPHANAWLDFYEADGSIYYHNFATGENSTERPPGFTVPAPRLVSDSIMGDDGFASFESLPVGVDGTSGVPGTASSTYTTGDDRQQQTRSGSAGSFTMADTQRAADGSLRVLHFTSWWNETTATGMHRRMMALYFDIPTGSCEVTLDGSDNVFNISCLKSSRGRVSAWDLHLGMKVDILGRMTTLMQADLLTLEWLAEHERDLRRIKRALLKELRKYAPHQMANILKTRARDVDENDPGSARASQLRNAERGSRSLRGLRNLIRELALALEEFRPEIAREIAGDVLTTF